MTFVTSASREFRIWNFLGLFPVIQVRTAVPWISPGDWCWGRWRLPDYHERFDAMRVLYQLRR